MFKHRNIIYAIYYVTIGVTLVTNWNVIFLLIDILYPNLKINSKIYSYNSFVLQISKCIYLIYL